MNTSQGTTTPPTAIEVLEMITKLTTHSSFLDYASTLDAGDDFTTHGALLGQSHPYDGATGHLPTEFHSSYATCDYAVFSYSTPIAWRVPGEGWFVPVTKYSRTTTRHQGKIIAALNQFTEIHFLESE